MLQRNLVYTAVTRGKRLVVLVGQRKALAIACAGSRPRRWSKLKEWLAAGVPETMTTVGAGGRPRPPSHPLDHGRQQLRISRAAPWSAPR